MTRNAGNPFSPPRPHRVHGSQAGSPPTFDLSITIRRPPAAVFALLADIQDYEPIPHDIAIRMVKEPAGPIMIGTQWHEWVRMAPGCWFHTESVVSELDPPRRLGMDFSSRWLSGRLVYEVEATAGGSILRQRETVQPRPLLRWLLPVVVLTLRPRLLQRLAEIKRMLEAPSVGQPPGPDPAGQPPPV